MITWLARFGWMGLGIVALYALSMLAGVASGGPLDPPGAPGSTMKTLDDIAPSWHQILAADDGGDGCHSSRFLCVMGDEAVLDRETGLVWEKAPSAVLYDWYGAVRRCQRSSIGGRQGWRAPKIEELRSLLDETSLLPAGVFDNVQLDGYYWSTSDDVANGGSAEVHRFSETTAPGGVTKTTVFASVWCVRGVGAGSDYHGG